MRVAIDAAGLRRECGRRGLTGAQLAVLSDLTPATISHVLNGRMASYTTVRKLSRVLATTPVLLGSEGIIGRQEEKDAAAPPGSASMAEVSFASATAG
jgi:transcriptional regulator with XRE-family HTH domain